MRDKEIEIGQIYMARIGEHICPCRILARGTRRKSRLLAVNLRTGRETRFTAAKCRREATVADMLDAAEFGKVQKHKRVCLEIAKRMLAERAAAEEAVDSMVDSAIEASQLAEPFCSDDKVEAIRREIMEL